MIPFLVGFLGCLVSVVWAVDLVATFWVELFGSESQLILRELLTVVCLHVALVISQVILGLLATHHHIIHLHKVNPFIVKLIRIDQVLTIENLRPRWILIRLLQVSGAHIELVIQPRRPAILALTYLARCQVLALLI